MRIIISGASIAGLSTAYWLSASGHEVTVVESSVDPRRGGVAIDVRGEALEVAREMGVLSAIAEARVSAEDIYYFLDAEGVTRATFEPAVQFYDSPGDIEISRDRLSDILQAAVPTSVDLRYHSWLTAVEQAAGGVSVTLNDGSRLDADLVVGADGMHSNVRDLCFGPEEHFLHHLGLYVAIVKRCAAGRGLSGSHVYNSPGRMLMLRGDGEECSALMGFRSPRFDYDFRDVDGQRALVREALADEKGWKTSEVLDEVDVAPDFYFDSVGQIKMDRWSRGRAVLVGDAAYCASFFSGMGTSLAMLGARTLARALDSEVDLGTALAVYDEQMRPVVDEAHEMAQGGAAILFPVTAEDIEARDQQMRDSRPG